MFNYYGAIVSIELPLMDHKIKEHIKNKTDNFKEAQKEQYAKEFRRAQQLVQESIESHEEYESFLIEHFGEEKA